MEPTIDISKCSSTSDMISFVDWTETAPDVFINFIADPNKTGLLNCYTGENLAQWTSDKSNTFAEWVQKPSSAPMDNAGHGGAPDLKNKFTRLYTGEYVRYKDLKDIRNGKINLFYNAYPLGVKRIGNLQGQFTVSGHHGQAPGYMIYGLKPMSESSEAVATETETEPETVIPTPLPPITPISTVPIATDSLDDLLIAMEDNEGNLSTIGSLISTLPLPPPTAIAISDDDDAPDSSDEGSSSSEEEEEFSLFLVYKGAQPVADIEDLWLTAAYSDQQAVDLISDEYTDLDPANLNAVEVTYGNVLDTLWEETIDREMNLAYISTDGQHITDMVHIGAYYGSSVSKMRSKAKKDMNLVSRPRLLEEVEYKYLL